MDKTLHPIEYLMTKYGNKGFYPTYYDSIDKYELKPGYILFRCHPTNVLTPKKDEDTGKFGCYFCDNCPRLAVSMVYEHQGKYPDGLVCSVYQVMQPIICNNGKYLRSEELKKLTETEYKKRMDEYFKSNHYDIEVESMFDWIDSSMIAPDKDIWCNEIFIIGNELHKLKEIENINIEPWQVSEYYLHSIVDFNIPKDRNEMFLNVVATN